MRSQILPSTWHCSLKCAKEECKVFPIVDLHFALTHKTVNQEYKQGYRSNSGPKGGQQEQMAMTIVTSQEIEGSICTVSNTVAYPACLTGNVNLFNQSSK